MCEFARVDVAAGDDADDFAGTRCAVERAGDGAGAGAFGDDVVVLDQETEGVGDGIQVGDERPID